MVKTIQMFEDSAGDVHRCPLDAARSDLALWFAASGQIKIDQARVLVNAVTATSEMNDVMGEMVDNIRSAHITAQTPTTVQVPA